MWTPCTCTAKRLPLAFVPFLIQLGPSTNSLSQHRSPPPSSRQHHLVNIISSTSSRQHHLVNIISSTSRHHCKTSNFQNVHPSPCTSIMWPFASQSHQLPSYQVAVRPHPSRILRAHSRRTKPLIEHDRMVIVVRADVPLSPGRLAQHVASVVVRLFQRVCRPSTVCSRWNRTGQPKAILRVNDAQALERITQNAIDRKIPISAAHVKHGDSHKVRTLIGLFGPAKSIDPLVRGLKPY